MYLSRCSAPGNQHPLTNQILPPRSPEFGKCDSGQLISQPALPASSACRPPTHLHPSVSFSCCVWLNQGHLSQLQSAVHQQTYEQQRNIWTIDFTTYLASVRSNKCLVFFSVLFLYLIFLRMSILCADPRKNYCDLMRTLINRTTHANMENIGGPLTQPDSSLWSGQSGTLLHCLVPWMQDPSPHWNSSGRHVSRAVRQTQTCEYITGPSSQVVSNLFSFCLS